MNPEDVIILCQELIRIPSKSGEERTIVQFLAEKMAQWSFSSISIDSYGSITGEIHGGSPGPTLLLDGHLDTVGVEDASSWHVDPFGGELREGRIWGRGATDMKGSVAAMLSAMATVKEEMEIFPGKVVFSGTVSEETLGFSSFIPLANHIKPDYVIIGEPSNLTLCRGQKGRFEFQMITHGKTAHAAFPEKGVNAVLKMIPVIMQTEKLKLPEDPFLGSSVMALVDIISEPYPSDSMIPSRCRATYERRLSSQNESHEALLQELRTMIDDLKLAHPDLEVEVRTVRSQGTTYTHAPLELEKHASAWIMPERSALVQASLRAMEQAGVPPAVSYYSFSTNGGYSAGPMNIETVGFGPSSPELAHISDEYIEVRQLLDAWRVYIAMIKELFAVPATHQPR